MNSLPFSPIPKNDKEEEESIEQIEDNKPKEILTKEDSLERRSSNESSEKEKIIKKLSKGKESIKDEENIEDLVDLNQVESDKEESEEIVNAEKVESKKLSLKDNQPPSYQEIPPKYEERKSNQMNKTKSPSPKIKTPPRYEDIYPKEKDASFDVLPPKYERLSSNKYKSEASPPRYQDIVLNLESLCSAPPPVEVEKIIEEVITSPTKEKRLSNKSSVSEEINIWKSITLNKDFIPEKEQEIIEEIKEKEKEKVEVLKEKDLEDGEIEEDKEVDIYDSLYLDSSEEEEKEIVESPKQRKISYQKEIVKKPSLIKEKVEMKESESESDVSDISLVDDDSESMKDEKGFEEKKKDFVVAPSKRNSKEKQVTNDSLINEEDLTLGDIKPVEQLKRTSKKLSNSIERLSNKLSTPNESPIYKTTVPMINVEEDRDEKAPSTPKINLSLLKKNSLSTTIQFSTTLPSDSDFSPLTSSPYQTIYVQSNNGKKLPSFDIPETMTTEDSSVKRLVDIFAPLTPTQEDNLYEQAKNVIMEPLESSPIKKVSSNDDQFISSHLEKLLGKNSDGGKSLVEKAKEKSKMSHEFKPPLKKPSPKRTMSEDEESFSFSNKKSKKDSIEFSEDSEDDFKKKLQESRDLRKEKDKVRSRLAKNNTNTLKVNLTPSQIKKANKHLESLEKSKQNNQPKEVQHPLQSITSQTNNTKPQISRLLQPQTILKSSSVLDKISDINKKLESFKTNTTNNPVKKPEGESKSKIRYSEERKIRMENLRNKITKTQENIEEVNKKIQEKNSSEMIIKKPIAPPKSNLQPKQEFALPKPKVLVDLDNSSDYNYPISPYKSDNDDEDSYSPKKKSAKWTKTPQLQKQLKMMNPNSAERIFGRSQKTCDLNSIFNSKKNFNRKNSIRWVDNK